MSVADYFQKVEEQSKETPFSMEKSISLINVRVEAMTEFCRFLSLLAVMKLNGDSIENHPILKRLIFLKTFLTKLKPINKKIEYQIGKMIRTSMKSKLENRDALQAASKKGANLGNFDLDGEEEDDEELSDDDVDKFNSAANLKKNKLTYMVSKPSSKNTKKK
jgi:hypothetical protein